MAKFPTMSPMVRRVAYLAGVGVVLLLAVMNWSWLSGQWSAAHAAKPTEMPEEPRSLVELARDKDGKVIEDAVVLDAELLKSPRFTTAKVEDSPAPEPLKMSGSIITDQNRSARVRSLFAGQVVKIGLKGDMSKTTKELSAVPENGLRPNDFVKKGQILAVVFCKDVGEKKSELVDQTSQMFADKRVLERYLSVEKGIVSLNQLTTQIRAYMQDVIAMNRAERTLRSWGLTEDEIDAVKREALRMDKLNEEIARVQGDKFAGIKPPDTKSASDLENERAWAEVAIRAPFDGRITEKNCTVGDIVDPTVDLYKIAKLDRMQVLVHAYEEDLPKLWQLNHEAEQVEANAPAASIGLESERDAARKLRDWKISYQANLAAGETDGQFDKLGIVIDPAQHTGSVTGWVNNPEGKLFIGQFVSATIALPGDPTLVSIPTDALVEDVDGPIVFVKTGDQPNQFTKRKVAVAVRGREKVFLRKAPNPVDVRNGAQAIKPGDVVLQRGALEVCGELQNLQSQTVKAVVKPADEKTASADSKK